MIDSAYLEGGENGWSSTDKHFRIDCGLAENIVSVCLIEDNRRDTALFRDEALYRLVRHSDDREELIDRAAFARFEDILVPRMEATLENMSQNPGGYSGYELTQFSLLWSYEDERDGGDVELYDFNYVLLVDDPLSVVWAGGMRFDSELRVRGFSDGCLAVKYGDGGEISISAFMGNDFYYSDEPDYDKDLAMRRISVALDTAALLQPGLAIDERIINVLNSDGAYATMALDALLDSLIDEPAATFEAIGARYPAICDWVCWALAAHMDGMALDTGDALAAEGLTKNGQYARDTLWKYMSGDYAAPPHWRKSYMSFWKDELPGILDGMEIDGIGLLDTDADGVAELLVLQPDGNAVLYYTNGEKVYHNIGSTFATEELDFGGYDLRVSAGDTLSDEMVNALLNSWRP